MIELLQENGEPHHIETADLERFRYGRLLYVPELGVLTALETEGTERRFKALESLHLKRSRLPAFLDEHREALGRGTLILENPLGRLEIFEKADRVELEAGRLERGWRWLSARYGFGESSVSLADILDAQLQGLPFLEVEGGWVDLGSPAMARLGELAADAHRPQEPGQDEELGLSPMAVLRLVAAMDCELEILGKGVDAGDLRRLIELRPGHGVGALSGHRGELREYQTIGVDWLRFLVEHRLGGLLCDDMGLGKTHQVMALLLSLHELDGIERPCLVVCPRTVLSHWKDKIARFAPGLEVVVYHGPDRSIDALPERSVVLTSYGILSRDSQPLQSQSFAVAVLDEIQNLKNPKTRGHRAAAELRAEVKIGLTGTPIENSLADLEALMALVLPGASMASAGQGEASAEELRRLAAPFVLRRLKSAVLDELPEKIEDTRTCPLSEDQIRLYREAVDNRSPALVERLQDPRGKLPYIHIFALLSLLKQICDHPSVVAGPEARYDSYESGKWDLFLELLDESLQSGQKVVVFSQYLRMIDLMESYLADEGIGAARLTGATKRRGEVIARFNEEASCRVFLGSLKAGGTGIDLVGGSVVIHYDRWWNAAREDQATDRVHRMGQHRAVQVFKLVTEGTLEEKIAVIIEQKRRLLDEIVTPDDPSLGKIFDRQQLLSLLEPV